VKATSRPRWLLRRVVHRCAFQREHNRDSTCQWTCHTGDRAAPRDYDRNDSEYTCTSTNNNNNNHYYYYYYYYTVSQKKQSKLFSSELRQISTNFDNFRHKDGQYDEIMWGALIIHLTWFVSTHYHVKRRRSKLWHNFDCFLRHGVLVQHSYMFNSLEVALLLMKDWLIELIHWLSGISDVCLECGLAVDSVEHLFNC